jgi:hypothetical protein
MKRTGLAFLLSTLLVPVLATAATRVSSNSDCPSSDAISVRLLGLLSAGGPEAATALVTTDVASMRIELSTPGESARERTVPLTGDCDQRAEMAALVIASWLDVMPVGTLKTPGIPPKEVRVGDGRTGDASSDGDALGDLDDGRVVVSTRKRFAIGGFGLADKDGANAGVSFDLGMPNLLDALGWMAQVQCGLPRTRTVGQGVASYWRPTVGLAVTGEILSSVWVVRAHIGPELGVLAVSGSGYEQNHSDTTVTWGADAGLTIARSFERRQLWLRIEGAVWPSERNLRSNQVPSGPDIAVPLSGWEARVVAGYAWGAR